MESSSPAGPAGGKMLEKVESGNPGSLSCQSRGHVVNGNAPPGGNGGGGGAGTNNTGVDDNGEDSDELNDVMEVLTSLTRKDLKTTGSSLEGNANGVDALTSVQDVAKVVDKMEVVEEEVVSPGMLAQRKFLKASERQLALEKRLHSLASRINHVRCRQFGSHISKEIGQVRLNYEKFLPTPVAPPAPPPLVIPPTATMPPSGGLAGSQVGQPLPAPLTGQLLPQPQLLPPGAINPPQGSAPSFSPGLISLSAAFQQQQQGQMVQVNLPSVPLVPPQLQLQSLQPGMQLPPTLVPPTQIPPNGAMPKPEALGPTVVRDESEELPLQPKQRKLKKSKKLQQAETGGVAKAEAEAAAIATPPAPSEEEKQQFSETLGKLNANLHHLIVSYDSEATESSSGGESCDEFEGYEPESVKTVPLRKRAKYSWLKNRAGIASRWTWLTAQIADLEYRIRQQTELYRQIRQMKGPLYLGDQQQNIQQLQQPTPVPSINRQSVFRLEAEEGAEGAKKRLLIKGPADPISNPEETVCARTRPVKGIKKRCVMTTAGFYRVSARAAKESTVSCGCLRPTLTCAICYGRSNHSLVPDPAFHDRAKTLALLDHSYHQVLSRQSTDISTEVVLSQKLKNRSWMMEGGASAAAVNNDQALGLHHHANLSGSNTPGVDVKRGERSERVKEIGPRVLSKYMRKKLDERRRQKEMMGEDAGDVEEEYFLSKLKRKKLKREKSNRSSSAAGGTSGTSSKKRKKSVTVSHHSDAIAVNDIHEAYDEDEPNSSHSTSAMPTNSSATSSVMEQIRRKRETSFDIDNIVIPYSTMASARVEKLKYKEIQTPYWREVEGSQHVVIPALTPSQPKSETEEDISELNYIVRHKKAELEEQARWKTLAGGGSTGGQRGAAAVAAAAVAAASGGGGGSSGSAARSQRRQDSRPSTDAASSGCNTPIDPMSPVELEVTTRPSTPEGAELVVTTPNSTPSSIRNRRRTSSTTAVTIPLTSQTSRSGAGPADQVGVRDRNPSEDMSNPSRCTTPAAYEVPPYEPRQFPLSRSTYEAMVNNTEAATAVFIGMQSSKQPLVNVGKSSDRRRVSLSSSSAGPTPQVVISRLRISRDSSIDEEVAAAAGGVEEVVDSDDVDTDLEGEEDVADEEMVDEDEEDLDEEDPEWMEDEDDPEYKPSADD